MDPGFYADLNTQDYLDDKLDDSPSLNCTIAKFLVDACPARARHEHPRLGTNGLDCNGLIDVAAVNRSTRAMDRGSVAHTMLLGRGKEFDVIPYDSRRSKAAKLACTAAEAEGKVAIVADEYQRAAAMVTAAREQLAAIDRYAFDGDYGYPELCVFARDPVGPSTRALIDWYGDRHPDGLTLWDYKTTEGSANPDTLRWHATRQGWALQAAFQQRILYWLRPQIRPRFKFLVQETAAPFLCSVVEPDPAAMLLAHKAVAAAIGLWQRCMVTGVWPGYPTDTRPIGVTAGTEAAWLEREYDPALAAIIAADPFLNIPTSSGRELPPDVPPDAPAEAQDAPKRRGGRPRLTPEERARRAALRDGEVSPPPSAPRKLDL